MLITTHYMDEADKLCDRIAIVDHGKLVALDSPLRLKASVPGTNMIEVSFADTPPDWMNRLAALPGVERVTGDPHVARTRDRQRPGDDDGADDGGHAAPASASSRSASRARRSTTSSCTTRAGSCATRCRSLRRPIARS